MFKSMLDFARRHIILFGAMKFFAGFIVGGGLGFMLGIYLLPILVADAPAPQAQVAAAAETAEKRAVFRPDLPASDAFHWGEGTLYVMPNRVVLDGEVSPGPDYRLYLTPRHVETGEDFLAIKSQSVQVARIKGFKNFAYDIATVDPNAYEGALIWCERFSVFITSGRLQ